METVVANLAGKVRREKLHGRDYLVAPLTLIVPGVLNGSDGALYYPPEEIEKSVDAWNGMPILIGHPMVDGVHVSGRDPEIIEKYGVGHLYRNSYADKLSAEGWFDAHATKLIAPKFFKKLEADEQEELSTGLFLDKRKAPEGATHNSKPYDYVTENYRPDHLAVLLGEVGACSVKDGCGVNVNAAKQPELFPEEPDMADRKANIAWLTANCDCWKDDKDGLEKLSDERLTKLRTNAEKGKKAEKFQLVANALMKKGVKGVLNADGEEGAATGPAIPEMAELFGIDIDPAQDPVGFTNAITEALEAFLAKLKGAKPAEEEPAAEPMVAAAPAANRAKPQSDADWLKAAPPSIRSAVQNAMKIEQAEKQAIITKLVANVAEDRRTAHAKWLQTKSLDELNSLLELLPEREAEPVYNYSGASGGPPSMPSKDDSDNVLPIRNVSFEDQASPKLRRKA